MKKLLAFVLALVFMFALPACVGTKDSGEPAAGAAFPDMPNTDISTTETKQSQPADIEAVDIEAVSWTVSRVGTEEAYELTAEETAAISDILNNGNWVSGLTRCYRDCAFTTADGNVFYYSSACGTFIDDVNEQCLSVTDSEKESINAVLSQYIIFAPEQS